MSSNQEQNPPSVQVGDEVLLKPLEECEPIVVGGIVHSTVGEFFGGNTIIVVEKLGTDYGGKVFKDLYSGWWFRYDWIARIVSRAGEQRPDDKNRWYKKNPDPVDGNREFLQEWQVEPPVAAEQAGPVTVGVDLAAGESVSMNWYNPATHRLIPVSEHVGPGEFSELKDAAKGYARVVNFLIECGHSVGDGLNVSADDVLNTIARMHYKSIESRPITAAPGPPDLEGVPDEALVLVTWAETTQFYKWHCFSVRILKQQPDISEITYHVGPILPPGERKDGAE